MKYLKPLRTNKAGNVSDGAKIVDNNEPQNPNNDSIIVQLDYITKKYLFMGDVEKEVEAKLLKEKVLETLMF